jgi:hypothetical protein
MAELTRQIQGVKRNIAQQRQRLQAFDRSVKLAQDVLRQRGRIVSEFVSRIVEENVALIQQYAEEGVGKDIAMSLQDSEATLHQLEAKLTLLNQSATSRVIQAHQPHGAPQWSTASPDGLNNEYCDMRDLAKTSEMLGTGSEFSMSACSNHTSHIFLPNTSLLQWQPCIQDFISHPQLAQTSETSKMAVALKLTCTAKTDAEVLGLRVLSDNRILVSVNTDDPERAFLKLCGETWGLAEEITMTNSCKMLVFSGSLALLCTLSGKVITLDSPKVERFLSELQLQDHHAPEGAYTLSMSSPGDLVKGEKKRKKSAGKAEQHEVFQVTGTNSKHVFDVHVDNPKAVITSSSGNFLAVIQKSETTEDHVGQVRFR